MATYIYIYICLRVLNWTPFRAPFSGSHETTIKTVFSEPETSAQICRVFDCFSVKGFSSFAKFGFFGRQFSHGVEKIIKTVVSGTREQKKDEMPNFVLFCVPFLTLFLRPSFLPLWRFSWQTISKTGFWEGKEEEKEEAAAEEEEEKEKEYEEEDEEEKEGREPQKGIPLVT